MALLGFVLAIVALNSTIVVRIFISRPKPSAMTRVLHPDHRFGGHLSDVLESQIAYCAHNAVVIAEVGERVAILDILGGHSKRCGVDWMSPEFCVYLEADL